jgi:hypothetical protein
VVLQGQQEGSAAALAALGPAPCAEHARCAHLVGCQLLQVRHGVGVGAGDVGLQDCCQQLAVAQELLQGEGGGGLASQQADAPPDGLRQAAVSWGTEQVAA